MKEKKVDLSQIFKTKVICPKCRMRQLNSNLFCVDCCITWTKDTLKFYEERRKLFLQEYEDALRKAHEGFKEKVSHLLRETLKMLEEAEKP